MRTPHKRDPFGMAVSFVMFVALSIEATHCFAGESGDEAKPPVRKNQRQISHYEIFQPNINYPNDDVILWMDPGRNQRAFMLKPGTKVDVIEIVDGEKFGSMHLMYRIRTADGREGWIL